MSADSIVEITDNRGRRNLRYRSAFSSILHVNPKTFYATNFAMRIIFHVNKIKSISKKTKPTFVDLFRLTLYWCIFLNIEFLNSGSLSDEILEREWRRKIRLGINPHRDHSSESTALVCADDVNYKRDYVLKSRLIIKVLELRWKSMERVVGWEIALVQF